MQTEAQKKAILRYNKRCTRQITLRLNLRTDDDILTWLDGLPNKQGYIKQLIREDMRRG